MFGLVQPLRIVFGRNIFFFRMNKDRYIFWPKIVLIGAIFQSFGRIAQVVERRPLDREVRGSNPSHDTMALLLGRLSPVWDNKGKERKGIVF
jgi:hypothetical protein